MIQSPCPSWHAWGCDFVLQELHQNLLQSCGAQRAPQTQGGLFVVSVLVSGTAGQSCCLLSMYQNLHPQDRFCERGFISSVRPWSWDSVTGWTALQ